MSEPTHGGVAVARALKALGVEHLFTLTGGHIFPILDGCHQEDIRIVDTRHEQNAAFAAEGWARLTRTLGVVAITAGPGVTNVMSPLTQAGFNQAAVLALAGRAPQHRWGQGSLQEIDHIPFVGPIAPAATVREPTRIASEVYRAARAALRPPRGPRFLDFPLDLFFEMVDPETDVPEQLAIDVREKPSDSEISRVAGMLGSAERPMILVGSNVYLDAAEDGLLGLVEQTGIPVFMNGQGRGCVPADHHLAFGRSRSKALSEADVVIVAGAPMDFRLGFGQNFAPGAKIVHLDSADELLATHVELAAGIGAPLAATFSGIADAVGSPPDTKEWAASLRSVEVQKTEQAQADLTSPAVPIHPMRIYGELLPLLQRDAIVIGDGGDFVSFAGREVPSFEPGCWLDPGPYGCLGIGPGYALAARLAHPNRQVVLLLGDGALGFSGVELESLVRHGLPVVCIVGNNGVWALEKHPMRGVFGYDVAADLQPGIRYDQMMEAFGGQGALVTEPDDLQPALRKAFESGEPYLVNVITDPEIPYPRSANLA